MVGLVGLEPTTPCSQSKCASQLRYSPKDEIFRWRMVAENEAFAKGARKFGYFFFSIE